MNSETLEIYKLAVEMADRVSARRSAANSFYIGLQSAITAILTLLWDPDANPRPELFVAICIAGMATSTTWFLQLRSYRDLNRAKFEVINAMEQSLSVSIFKDEWASLRKDPIKWWRPRYAELGTVERVVPTVFLVLNIVLAVFFWRAS